MAGYPPPYPPPGFDPRRQRRFERDQARAQQAAMHAQIRGMRRNSILGPIVLIIAGTVFLLMQTGRLNYARVWLWYGRWWPMLLIAAGVIVLAEWMVDQHAMRDPQRPAYRRSFGGGLFLLLLFVLLGAGVIGHHVRAFSNGWNHSFYGFDTGQDLDELLGDKHESDQTLDFALPPGAAAILVNPRGNVTVSGASEDNRVHVAIHKEVYASSDSDAQNKAQRFVPTTSSVGSNFNLTMPSMSGARADLVITLPAATATTVTADRGDVEVTAIKAAVSVNANQGSVHLSAITGPSSVRMNSTKASLTAGSLGGSFAFQGRVDSVSVIGASGPVTIDGDVFGATHLEQIGGAIRFHTRFTDLQFARMDGQTDVNGSDISADQVTGPIVLHTGTRNVSLNRVSGDVAVSSSNGTIELTAAPALGNISVANRNGEVNVTMPQKAGFNVDARTSNGDFTTDLPLLRSGPENSKTLAGAVNGGGPLLHIVTTNGDVSIRTADVQPLPATAAPAKIRFAPDAAGAAKTASPAHATRR